MDAAAITVELNVKKLFLLCPYVYGNPYNDMVMLCGRFLLTKTDQFGFKVFGMNFPTKQSMHAAVTSLLGGGGGEEEEAAAESTRPRLIPIVTQTSDDSVFDFVRDRGFFHLRILLYDGVSHTPEIAILEQPFLLQLLRHLKTSTYPLFFQLCSRLNCVRPLFIQLVVPGGDSHDATADVIINVRHRRIGPLINALLSFGDEDSVQFACSESDSVPLAAVLSTIPKSQLCRPKIRNY